MAKRRHDLHCIPLRFAGGRQNRLAKLTKKMIAAVTVPDTILTVEGVLDSNKSFGRWNLLIIAKVGKYTHSENVTNKYN